MKACSRSRGFTLVEVLVASALLSLLMLGLVAAMRSFAQSETRIDEHLQRGEDIRATSRFLRAVMGSISPRQTRPVPGRQRPIAFAGGGDELNWIGVMPARHGAGGLYRFRLFVRQDSGTSALALEFAPLTNFDAPLESAPLQSRLMVADIASVAFRYQDGPQSDAGWVPAWTHADRLPRRVGVQITTRKEAWPEIVVAVTPAVGPGTASRAGGGAGPMVGPL